MLSGAVLDTGSGGGGNGPAIFTKGIISALPNLVSGSAWSYQIPFSQGVGPYTNCAIVNASCDIPSAATNATTPNNSYTISGGGVLTASANISATVENDYWLISYKDSTSTTYYQNYAAYNAAHPFKIITPANLGFLTQGNVYTSGSPLATLQSAGATGSVTWTSVTSYNGLTYPFSTGTGNSWTVDSTTGKVYGTATHITVDTIAVTATDGGSGATDTVLFTIGTYQYVTGAPRPSQNPSSGTSGGVACGPGFFTLNGELYEPNGTLFRMNHTWAATYNGVGSTISTPFYNAMGINALRTGPESDGLSTGTYPETTAVTDMISQHSDNHRFWWCGRWNLYAADGGTLTTGSVSLPLMGLCLKEWVAALSTYSQTGAGGSSLMNQIGIQPANEWGHYSTTGLPYLYAYEATQAPITAMTATTLTYSGSSNAFVNNEALGFVFIKGAGGVSDQLCPVTATGGSSGAWTLTGTFPTGYTSGGTVWGGAVGILRAAGYYCPIFICASGGDSGGPPADITSYGATIIASDPLQSIVWDYHTYYTGGTDSTSQSGFESQTLSLLNTERSSTGAPFVSGEVGIYYPDGRAGSPSGGVTVDFATPLLLQSFNKYGVPAHGWVSYSTAPHADSTLGFIRYNASSSHSDNSDPGYPTSFTVYGKRIALDPIYGSIVNYTGGATSF